jgi:hypothetical protein
MPIMAVEVLGKIKLSKRYARFSLFIQNHYTLSLEVTQEFPVGIV